MPRLSGISVIKELRRQFPDMRILVLTIHESDQYVIETFEAGANGYCIKDASREELLLVHQQRPKRKKPTSAPELPIM